MADQFDQAQEIDALMRASAMAQQAKKAASEPKLVHTGECHNLLCGEPLDAPRLFCDAECATTHGKRK